jgi:hypothetical protein
VNKNTRGEAALQLYTSGVWAAPAAACARAALPSFEPRLAALEPRIASGCVVFFHG